MSDVPVRLSDRIRGVLRRPAPGDPVPPDWTRDPLVQPYVGGDGTASGLGAVLLCHGFTSTPQSMRPWADHLRRAGFSVSVPLLPGHGTTWQQLNDTPWEAWYAEVDAAFTALAREHERVFVAGLSMGGALALHLAAQHGPRVNGLCLVNPCINITDWRMKILPVLARVVPSLSAIADDIAEPGAVELAYDRNPLRALLSQSKMWAVVRSELGTISTPMSIFRSAVDHVVDPSSVRILTERVAADDVRVEVLTRSYHVATLDYDAEHIFDSSVGFFRRL